MAPCCRLHLHPQGWLSSTKWGKAGGGHRAALCLSSQASVWPPLPFPPHLLVTINPPGAWDMLAATTGRGRLRMTVTF